jgi:hypothetical protein
MQLDRSIDEAAGAWAHALVTAAYAPVVLAAATGAAAADVWGAAVARPLAGRSAAPFPRTLFWSIWPSNLVVARAPARNEPHAPPPATGFAAYRTAGGHAVAQTIPARTPLALA